jgi:glycogen operon protein
VLAADLPPADPLADADPQFDRLAPFFEMVADDPVLSGVKLIAEPWMAGVDYAEEFPTRWSSWNGAFRDDIRDFWREPPLPQPSPSLRTIANRLAGSPDRFGAADGAGGARGPSAAINLVTCHDGFTLADLVSYNAKHNLANPTNDGTDENHSWNCGSEGPTADPGVLELRSRQARNMLVTLLVAIGVPMLLGGDELRRTQRGNNNCWCQDDELSWLDWSSDDGELTSLISMLLQVRRRHPELQAAAYSTASGRPLPGAGLSCYGTTGDPLTDPDLDAPDQHAFGVLFDSAEGGPPELCLLLNGYHQPLPFDLPRAPAGTWTVLVDTRVAFGQPLVTSHVDAGGTVELVERSAILLEQ